MKFLVKDIKEWLDSEWEKDLFYENQDFDKDDFPERLEKMSDFDKINIDEEIFLYKENDYQDSIRASSELKKWKEKQNFCFIKIPKELKEEVENYIKEKQKEKK